MTAPLEASLLADFVTGLRIMDGMGLTEGFGHLSLRSEDGIWMTPAMGPGMATAEDLVLVDPEGKKVGGADRPLALETPMHLGIYRARPDVTAICRTHSAFAVSAGAVGTAIPASHGFSLMLGQTIPCHREIDLIHSAPMGDAVAASLGNAQALLIRGNGALAVGPTLRHAVVHAIYLEEAARIAIQIGQQQTPAITDAEYAARKRWHTKEAARAWDYYAWRYQERAL